MGPDDWDYSALLTLLVSSSAARSTSSSSAVRHSHALVCASCVYIHAHTGACQHGTPASGRQPTTRTHMVHGRELDERVSKVARALHEPAPDEARRVHGDERVAPAARGKGAAVAAEAAVAAAALHARAHVRPYRRCRSGLLLVLAALVGWEGAERSPEIPVRHSCGRGGLDWRV